MQIMMLDTETLGLSPKSLVTQIAAGWYDLEARKMIALWSWLPNLDEQWDRKVDAKTVMWWLKQSNDARLAITGDQRTEAYHIWQEVKRLAETVGAGGVWAKPATFDLPLLADYFEETTAEQQPWHYRQARDMQTIARLYDPHGLVEMTVPKDDSRAHDASYDVLWQCDYLAALYHAVGGFKLPEMAIAEAA